eukprot:scaffold2422_cov56-Attheya_sp.AAC.11
MKTPTSTTNPTSMYFLPTNFTENRAYSNFIADELLLRELETNGDLLMRKERLVTALHAERQYRNLAQKLKHAIPKENALFLMMQAIPCILHCSNRVNIKLLSVLLTDGLNTAKTKKILSEHASIGKHIDKFILGVEMIVNQSILGTITDPAQWSLPVKDDNTKADTNIGTISMDNGCTVSIVIDKLVLLTDYCIPESVDSELSMQWKNLCLTILGMQWKKYVRRQTSLMQISASIRSNLICSFSPRSGSCGICPTMYTNGEIYTYTPSKAGIL